MFRLKEAIQGAGGQTKVSAALKVDPKTVGRWEREETSPKFDDIVALAELAGVSVDWIAGRDGTSGRTPPTSGGDSYPIVPLYDAEASAGHGSFVDHAPVKDHIPFTQDFLLRRLGRTTAEGLICVYARGDSMEPTIGNGDLLLVDTHKRELTSAVFALVTDAGFWVKRLNPGLDVIEVISDNKAYNPLSIRRDLDHTFEILGRVVWVGHTL